MESVAVVKIFCTGNPSKVGIASEVRHRWPGAVFASKSNGYDFTNWTSQSQGTFERTVALNQVFINCIFVAPGIQEYLLDQVCEIWMKNDVKGHIISLGTTLEWDPNHADNHYVQSKLRLRNKSLDLNDRTGITGIKTTYVIVGGISDGTEKTKDLVPPKDIVSACEWLLALRCRIPLLQIDSAK